MSELVAPKDMISILRYTPTHDTPLQPQEQGMPHNVVLGLPCKTSSTKSEFDHGHPNHPKREAEVFVIEF